MNGQTGFSGFINRTEMVSFSSFARTVGWFIASVAFTYTACAMLLNGAPSWGLQLAVAVLGGLGVASGIGAYNTKTVRTSAKEYAPIAEAKARGKAAAVVAEKVEKVEVAAPTNGVVIGQPPIEEQHWATGSDPRAGVL